MKDTETIQAQRDLELRDIPVTVGAGSEAKFRVSVTSDPAADLSDQTVQLVNDRGKVIASATLVQRADHSSHEAEISFVMPPLEGRHDFIVRLREYPGAGLSYPEMTKGFTVQATSHETVPVVWAIPPAIPKGERFLVRIGVRCGADCDTSGWRIEVRDHAGRIVAEGCTGEKVWPGTKGLRYTELELCAPSEEGLFAWEAHASPDSSELPHRTGRCGFSIRTTAKPEHVLRIHATDRKAGTPISGINVVAQPFRASTDEFGKAELGVPPGNYRVLVSGRGYITLATDCRVDNDTTLHVEMEQEVGVTEADVWA